MTRQVPSVLLVFSSAFAIAVVAWTILPTAQKQTRATDYLSVYQPVAVNLLAGRGLVTNDGAPAVRYPPAHSLFLAGIFWVADRIGLGQEVLLVIVSVFLHALSSTLLWKFSSLLWGPYWALLPTLLWCTYPPGIWFITLGGSETPFIPVLITTTMLFWIAAFGPRFRYFNFFVTGLGCAGAMLLRPIAVGIPAVLALVVWFRKKDFTRRRRVAAVAVLSGGALLLVLPWEVWMYRHMGKFLVLSTSGFPSFIDGLTFARPSEEREPLDLERDVAELMVDLRKEYDDGTVADWPQLLGWFGQQLVDRPRPALRLVGLKIVRCWYATDSHRHELALMLLQIPYGVAVFGAAVRAWTKGDSAREFAILVLALTCYNWLMATFVLSILRYSVPMIALLFALVPALCKARV